MSANLRDQRILYKENKMKKIPVLAFIIWLVVSGSVYAQMDTAFIKTTHLFSVKGNESLYLD